MDDIISHFDSIIYFGTIDVNGAMVADLPDGAKEAEINGRNYLIYKGPYFLLFSQNGQKMYIPVHNLYT